MPAPGEFLNPNSWARTAPGQAVWFGLQMLAPNIASLLTGQPPPALPKVPEMPGKVPSTDDPRIAGAIGEAANLGLNFLPLPATGVAAGAGRGILGLMQRTAPEGAGLAVDAGHGILGLIRRAAPEGAGLAVDAGRGILGRLSGPELLASKSARLYNPPAKSPRPFEADYPSGAPADATGRLTADIEGRPLVAERVVGRRTLGGADEALTPAELDAVAKEITGHRPEAVAARQIGGNAGVFRISSDAAGNSLYNILVDRSLLPATKDRVVAHELGHVIDHFAAPRRGLPQEDIKTELNRVYNAGVTGQERERHLMLPQHEGYRSEYIPGELMAEAIRAYLADPNYIKTVAPKTAAAIREAVNSNPRLSKILQFNTIAGLAAMNGIDSGSLPIPRQQPPVFPQ